MLRSVSSLLDTLFDFDDPLIVGAWESVGDPVMGGISTGSLLPLPGGLARFAGVVSLDRGGGFASVRSAPGRFDLSGHEGILLEIRGDGRVYKLSVRIDPWFDAVAYQIRFATRAGGWEEVRLPLAGFRATWRGRPVPGAPPLEPSRVSSFGLLLGDGQAGPFQLEIASIRAYRRVR
jgi:NADH dehydrogenase [ubiquinone] 1 alpha subcomplex assembly factor 1